MSEATITQSNIRMNKAKFYTMMREDQYSPYKPTLVDGYNIDGEWGTYKTNSYIEFPWVLINYATGLSVGKECRTRKEVGELYQKVKKERTLETHIEQYQESFQENIDTFNELLAEMGVQQYTVTSRVRKSP